MTTGHRDSELIEGFLEGRDDCVSTINTYIETACRKWHSEFGDDTDDIKSDASYKLLISLSRNEFNYRSQLSTYVTTIVNRTCIDRIRFEKRWTDDDISEMPLAVRELSQEEKLEKRQLGRLVYRVLRRMRRECLDLWRKVLKRNMKCAEIGREMGKSEANIRRRLWVCRQQAKAIRDDLLKKDKLLDRSSA